MNTWYLILGMAVITFANRYLFFVKAVRFKPSNRLTKFLEYSSFAILTAIWLPIIFIVDYGQELGTEQFAIEHAGLDYLVATLVAIVLTVMGLKSIYVVVLSTALFFSLRWLGV